MIIFLILISLFIIGITLWILNDVCWRTFGYDWVYFTSRIFTVIFGIILFIISFFVTIDHLTIDHQIAQVEEERAAIIYRIEQIEHNDTNLLVNGGVYNDVVKYNKKVRSWKYYGNNLWTNWFVPHEYTELEYISLPESGDP